MQQIAGKIWKRRFAIAVIAVIATLNFMPEGAVTFLRSSALELASLIPRTKAADSRNASAELRRENAALRAQARRLEGIAAALERELSSLGLLRDALPEDSLKAIPARVVLKRDITPLRRAIIIDRGTNHGCEEGMPVVSGVTLVGVIIASGAKCSRVQLVTDPAFRAVGRLAATGEEGLLEGSGAQDCLMKMKYLRNAQLLKEGQPVLTAGTLGRFPPGLLAGRVVGKPSRPENGFTWVRIAPELELDALESVAVLRGFPRGDEMEGEIAQRSKTEISPR